MISVLVNKTGRVSPAPAQCCQISRAHAHRRRFNFAPTQRSRRAAALLACRARSAVYVFSSFCLVTTPLSTAPVHWIIILLLTRRSCSAFTRRCPRCGGAPAAISRVSRAPRAFRFSPDGTRGVSNLKTTVGAVVLPDRTQDLYNRSKKRENKYSF